jgi:UDP-N-acetylmuramoyl-tripeptide--D-alanyl-D-alanine ligase
VWSAENIIKGVNGKPFRVEKDTFSAISTDSRTVGADEFFIPLKGLNFDGHDFIEAAYDKSSGGSLCDMDRVDIQNHSKGTLILVDDTNQGLLDLARYKRHNTSGTFVAITGSNGKTTTKELLVNIIGDYFSLVYNEKNYNNNVGVAKALLAIDKDPDFALFELGTNHPGEIAVLTKMVEPHISLITNVTPSHLEGLFDLEGVQKEKLSLFDTTLPGGTVVINADDPSISSYKVKPNKQALTFGIHRSADYMLKVIEDKGLGGFDILLTFPQGEITTSTLLSGRHNLYNVLAASTLASIMGIPVGRIGQALATFDAYKGRFKPVKSSKGYMIIDDAYNANPSSMRWAINTVTSLPVKGKKIAILGDMRELGERSEAYHRELGHNIQSSDIALILLLGNETKVISETIGNGRAKHFDNRDALIDYAITRLHRDDIVLVKGSRALGMDKIVEALV